VEPRIRAYRPEDERALYDICLRTGADGEDTTDRFTDPRLLGEVYVGPYLALERDLAFVVADDENAGGPAGGPAGGLVGGLVGGYVLGARDTATFEERCEASWWPPLRERYPLADWPGDGPDAAMVRLLHRPPSADPDVLARYPSHLHIDLLPSCQGGGWGRRLLETLFAALADAGSPGVHLGVSRTNQRAVGFYRRMGFTELSGDGGGLTMGRPLT
jgi:GNAT superfamily N-acetyltransferase